MPGFEKVRKNLEAHGFDVTCFDTAAEAADYLDRRLDGKTVGHGGSITLKELGLLERLQSHAVVRSHWPGLSDLGQRPGGDRRAHQHRRHGQPGGLHHLRP
jgi:L-lactate utilization protein LutB